ncbi:hypothetical protein C8D01_3544 [Simplicispira sp. 110]|nr:hypothetical protein C8D01_3544 [Simplicispira sp. 110]
MQKAHRVHLGVSYCSNCYPRIFPIRTCHICGGTARSHRAEERPVCRSCKLKDQTCLRCAKPTPRAALRVGDKAACAVCARYFRSAKPCQVCEKPTQRLTRVSGMEALGRMCDQCVRDQTCATCKQCSKHRTVFLMLLSREPLCKACAENLDATHACPDCGVTVGGTGTARCFACGIKRANWVKAQAAIDLMSDQQAQQLTLSFVGWANGSGRESKVAAGFARYAQALMRIDNAVSVTGGDIDDKFLQKLFTTEEIRSMGILAQYMNETGLLTANNHERLQTSLERLIERQLLEVAGKSWESDVRGFYRFMQAKEKPLSLRSIKVYLHVAIQLLQHSQVSRAAYLSDTALEQYLRKSPGSTASASAFVSYLRATGSVSLRLQIQKKAGQLPTAAHRAREVRRIQDRLEHVVRRHERLPLIAKLVSILFGARLEHVLQLRMDQLALSASGAKVFLKDEWVDAPQEVAALMREMAARPSSAQESGESWVFPGRMASDHLSTAAVQYHLDKLNA